MYRSRRQPIGLDQAGDRDVIAPGDPIECLAGLHGVPAARRNGGMMRARDRLGRTLIALIDRLIGAVHRLLVDGKGR